DLIVAGSVAVDERGARLGKGGGYSDLAIALARAAGGVGEKTPVVTTVHELQVVDDAIPMTAHDVPLDLLATPGPLRRTRPGRQKPGAIFWRGVSKEQLAEMPAVARLAPKRAGSARRRA